MSDLFILENNEIVISPNALMIESFAYIYKRDSSKDKEEAKKEFAYIYYMGFYKSEYIMAYTPEEREKRIIEDIFGHNAEYKPDIHVLEALKKYKDLQKTPTMRLLEAMRSGMETLIEYYNVLQGGKIDRNFDIKKFTDAYIKAREAIETLEKAENKVYREVEESKITGGGRAGLFERI